LTLTLNRPGEHDGKRGGEHVQRRAADGLIRLEVDGGKREQQRKHGSRERRDKDGKQHRPLWMRRAEAAGIHKAEEQAGAKRADDHNTFERDIDHAAALREHAAERNEEQRDHEEDGCTEDIR